MTIPKMARDKVIADAKKLTPTEQAILKYVHLQDRMTILVLGENGDTPLFTFADHLGYRGYIGSDANNRATEQLIAHGFPPGYVDHPKGMANERPFSE